MQSNVLHIVGTLFVARTYTAAERDHPVQKWFPDDLWTLNLEQSIVRGDCTSNVLYFAVLIFCAPIWEEVRVTHTGNCKACQGFLKSHVYFDGRHMHQLVAVLQLLLLVSHHNAAKHEAASQDLTSVLLMQAMFRGFMLPSFNKFMPKVVALLLTSAIFAMLHFSVQRFIPLVLLGVVLGLVYTRTRNLLAPISLHALWNMYIFYNLLMRGSGILGRLSVFMF